MAAGQVSTVALRSMLACYQYIPYMHALENMVYLTSMHT